LNACRSVADGPEFARIRATAYNSGVKPFFLAAAAATLAALAVGCATPEAPPCQIDRDCPMGQRCVQATGVCVPQRDGGGDIDVVFDDGAGTCTAAACTAQCLAGGFAGGACVGTTCQCAGTPPDGGTDDGTSADDAGLDTAICNPDECTAECAVFGLVGECGVDGCLCLGGGDADADGDDGRSEDAGPPDDGRTDDASPPDDGGTDDGGCPAGLTSCGGGCVDTRTSAAHCGGCGRACRADQICSGGSCGCPAGRTECSGTCRDLSTDPSNCGWCGNACTGGRSCSTGICLCTGGLSDCAGTCVSTLTDPNNCGWCGNRCACGPCTGGSCGSSGGSAFFTFPGWADTWYIASDPYLWNFGDYYQGVRSTSLSCATSVSFTLYADETYLDGDVLDLRLSINGTSVASFSFPMYSYVQSYSFSFPAITGPTYTIRLEVTRTVAYLCGSVALSRDLSSWTLM
jgi:hypothetical protein